MNPVGEVKYENPVCRGSLMLGTGCGRCEKCAMEKAGMMNAYAQNVKEPQKDKTDDEIALDNYRMEVERLNALIKDQEREIDAMSAYVKECNEIIEDLEGELNAAYDAAAAVCKEAATRVKEELDLWSSYGMKDHDAVTMGRLLSILSTVRVLYTSITALKLPSKGEKAVLE